MKRLPLLVVLALLGLAIALPMSGGMLGFGGASPGPTGIAAGPSASAVAPDTSPPPASTEPPPPSSSEPAATPDPTLAPVTPTPLADVAVVPVTHFRAIATKTNRAEVDKVLAGTSDRYGALVLVEAEADAILTSLGAARP